MESIIDQIRQALKDRIDPHTLESGPRFFKEKIKIHGVKIPEVNKIGKQFFKYVEAKSKEEIFNHPFFPHLLKKTGPSPKSFRVLRTSPCVQSR